MELMQASQQWASRPADERFCSLPEMFDYASNQMDHSKSVVVSSKSVTIEPTQDNNGLLVIGPSSSFAPTHWAFGQLAQRAGAPADYLRNLPSPLAADCLNWGMKYQRDIQDVGLLLYQNGGAPELRAVTGPNYGRIWNAEVIGQLCRLFGDGVSGKWHVPGEFNRSEPITKGNTTLYAGDRDMFAFLCDGEHDIDDGLKPSPMTVIKQSSNYNGGSLVTNPTPPPQLPPTPMERGHDLERFIPRESATLKW